MSNATTATRIVRNRLDTVWTTALGNMSKINNNMDVQPRPLDKAFTLSEETSSTVEVRANDIVFKVPEDAKSKKTLYICLSGAILIEAPGGFGKSSDFRTTRFQTRVAYFRAKEALQHVYGVHYDMDEERVAHPVFHGQMRPFLDKSECVCRNYKLDLVAENHMKGVLQNVRIPSAQMDFFSVVTQICADHMLDKTSDDNSRKAFQSVRKACDFFSGAAHRLEYLNSEPAISCYRSTHWYASPSATAMKAGD